MQGSDFSTVCGLRRVGQTAGIEGEGLTAMRTDDEVIDEDLFRAILHGVAAGACRVAARETGSAYWGGLAEDQRAKAADRLHHAAFAWSFAGTQCDGGMPSSASMRSASFRDGTR